MSYSLELREVSKSFGEFVAVDRLSMSVPSGTIFGLMGPNGAGKTTTLRMIMDIIAPDSGKVFLFGRHRRPQDAPRIGYLPEERGLYKKMRVIDHLVFLGELRGMRRSEALPAAEDWLERVELSTRARGKVEELSKGMQQKLQLAGTLLHQPEIVILDEPFSGLDPLNQALFKDLLTEYKQRGCTILFSTHVMEQAEKLCDSICLVSRGQAILTGELAAIKRDLGGNSYRLVAKGDLSRIEAVPFVEQCIEDDGIVKLLVEPSVDGSAVLRELVQFLDVREFRSEEPDLEEIFLKAVRDAT